MRKSFSGLAVFGACAAVFFILAGCGKVQQRPKFPNMKFITQESMQAVACPDEAHIWIAGNYGTLFHSSDGGTSWNAQDSGVSSLITSLSFIDSLTGWACGSHGTIIHTTDGGKTWTRQASGTGENILAIFFSDKEYGWAVGANGLLLCTADSGKTWTQTVIDPGTNYNNLWFAGRQKGWIVGEHGTILCTEDGGRTWKKKVLEFFKRANLDDEYENAVPSLFSIHFTDNQTGWVCGLYSTILHTTDGGRTWTDISNRGVDPLYSISAQGPSVWAVGDRGTYLVSHDSGATWELREDTIKTKRWFGQVVFSSPGRGWIVGAGGTVLKTQDGGENWQFLSGLSYEFGGFAMPDIFEKKVFE
jgi:photosystem II stability/assembly factor-like uncharacterized protein